MAEVEAKTTPRDVLRVVFRRRRLFVVGAAVFAIAALIGAQYWQVKYTGTAIFERRTDAAGQESTSRTQSDSFESSKLTLEHELAGRTALETAVEELGLTKGLARGPDGVYTLEGKMKKQELIQDLLKDIVVKWDVRSDQVDLISISFTHNDPELAQEMPNTLVKNYITKASEQIIQRLTDSKDFLQKQVDTSDVRVTELTKQRIEFEAQYAGMLPETPGALQQQADQMQTDIETLRRQQTVALQKLERNKELAKGTATDPDEPVQEVRGPNPEIAEIEKEIKDYKDRLEQATTVSRMTDNHPTVKTLKMKIEQLDEKKKYIEKTEPEVVIQKVFDTRPAANKGSVDVTMEIAAAQAEVDMTTAELERIDARLKQVQGLLANYAPVRQQYLELVKKLSEQEAEKDRWQKRLTEVQMALSAEVAKRRTHLNQVQLAEKQFRPSSPKLLYILGLALVGGLACGSGLVFITNVLDRSVFTTQEAGTHFGLPVCGVIGEIVTPHQRRWRRMRRLLIEPVVALLLLAVAAVAGLNIVLWLQFPEQYEQWNQAPWAYVSRQVADGAQRLRQAL